MRFRLVESNQNIDNLGNALSEQQMQYFQRSAVRDEEGRLVVCHHGTNASFDEFEKGDIGFHLGTLEQAEKRGSNVMELYANITNPLFIYFDTVDWNVDSFLAILFYGDDEDAFDKLNAWVSFIKKDRELDSFEQSLIDKGCEPTDEFLSDSLKGAFDELKQLALNYNISEYKYDSQAVHKLHSILKSCGYDGIKYENQFESHNGDYSYIAFYPNQIKRITNKFPTNSNNMNEVIV